MDQYKIKNIFYFQLLSGSSNTQIERLYFSIQGKNIVKSYSLSGKLFTRLPTSNFNFVDHYQLTSPFAFNTSFHTLAFILVFVCRPIYLGQNEIGLRSIFFITASCKLLKTIFLFYLMVYLLTSPPSL